MLGAAGGIGQPLSLLLKLNPKVTELSCFDLAPVTPGKRSFLNPASTDEEHPFFNSYVSNSQELPRTSLTAPQTPSVLATPAMT